MKQIIAPLLMLFVIVGGAIATTPATKGFEYTLKPTNSITMIQPTGTWTITMPWTTPITVPTKITPKPTKTITHLPPIKTETTYTVEPPTQPWTTLSVWPHDSTITSGSNGPIILPHPAPVLPITSKTTYPLPTITSITTIPRTGTWTTTMPWTTPTKVPTKITPRPTKTITHLPPLPTFIITLPEPTVTWITLSSAIIPVTTHEVQSRKYITMYATFLLNHGGYTYIAQEYSNGTVRIKYMVFDDKPAIMIIKQTRIKITYPAGEKRPKVIGIVYHYIGNGRLVRIETFTPLN